MRTQWLCWGEEKPQRASLGIVSRPASQSSPASAQRGPGAPGRGPAGPGGGAALAGAAEGVQVGVGREDTPAVCPDRGPAQRGGGLAGLRATREAPPLWNQPPWTREGAPAGPTWRPWLRGTRPAGGCGPRELCCRWASPATGSRGETCVPAPSEGRVTPGWGLAWVPPQCGCGGGGGGAGSSDRQGCSVDTVLGPGAQVVGGGRGRIRLGLRPAAPLIPV